MLGITDEHVAAIGSDDYMDSPLLTPQEKATVLWAEHVTRNTAKSRDDVAGEVQSHFTDAEFVELTFVIRLLQHAKPLPRLPEAAER